MGSPPQPAPDPNLELGLDAIAVPNPPPNDPDENYRKEKSALDLDSARLKNEAARVALGHKTSYARRTFALVASWIFLVFVLLLLQGFSFHNFKLSDSVLLAAIGSTTANVIGMLVIVLRHLFPSADKAS